MSACRWEMRRGGARIRASQTVPVRVVVTAAQDVRTIEESCSSMQCKVNRD